MSKPAHSIRSLLVAGLLGMSLSNCQDGGSELPNELRGEVVSGGHAPAANVEVGLYPVDYIPADSAGPRLAWTTRTDAAGRYAFKNVPSGRYNLTGQLDSLGFFRDSVSVAGAADIGRDSLGRLGSLSGTVRLQPGDDPRNAVIQVMGTDTYVNVAADGAFTLQGLAGGAYRLRASVSLPEYVPMYREVQVRAGRSDTLPAPLTPFFSGIPAVTGIRATYDTSRGIARIAWHPVAYPALLSYLVYRDPGNAVDLSVDPINPTRLADTVFYDTLYRYLGADRRWDDTLPHTWEYRVRVKATSNKIGEPYEAAVLHVVSPAILSTTVRIARLGGNPEEILRRDTVRFVAEYANPTVANRSLAWVHGADTLRKTDLAGRSGKDTLVWTAGSVLGPDSLRVSLVDANGQVWSGKLRLEVVASGVIGTILSPYSSMEAYAWRNHIVHVSLDSLRRVAIGLFDLAKRRDTLLSTAGKSDSLASALWGSKLYLFNVLHPDFAGANVLTFDLASGIWGRETSLPQNAIENSAAALNGKIYALAAHEASEDSLRSYELDPATHAWTARKSLRGVNTSTYVNRLCEADGSLYASQSMTGPYSSSFRKFDPAANEWTDFPISNRFRSTGYARLVGLKGNLYLVSGLNLSEFGYYTPWIDRFDPAQGAWVATPDFQVARGQPGVVAIGSSLYIVSGQVLNAPPTPTVEEYRPD